MNAALQQQLDLLREKLKVRNSGASEKGHTIADDASSAQAVDEVNAVVYRGAVSTTIQESTESFSERQVAKVISNLRPLAAKIFWCLHLLAAKHARTRGYHERCSQLTLFCPADAVREHLGLSRGSFYRSLKELKAQGLVDSRGHKTTLNGWQVRCDGTLWCIKLFPDRGGRARLRYDDLKGHYRDLADDIATGNTVWAQMRQSCRDKQMRVTFEQLLAWTLPPTPKQNLVTMTVAPEPGWQLEHIIDLQAVPTAARSEKVDAAARGLAFTLQDTNLDFYRYLLWQLLRLFQQGIDRFYTLHQMLVRVRADHSEGFARKAGALLVSRLKAAGLWEELQNVGKCRVGTKGNNFEVA